MPDVVEWQPPAPHPNTPRGDTVPCLVPLYDPALYAGHPAYLYPYYAAAVHAAYQASKAGMKCIGERSIKANERWALLNKDTFQEIFDNTLHEMTGPIAQGPPSPEARPRHKPRRQSQAECAPMSRARGGVHGELTESGCAYLLDGAANSIDADGYESTTYGEALTDITNDSPRVGAVDEPQPLDLSTRGSSTAISSRRESGPCRDEHCDGEMCRWASPVEHCEQCLAAAATNTATASLSAIAAPRDPSQAALLPPRGLATHHHHQHKAGLGRTPGSCSMREAGNTHTQHRSSSHGGVLNEHYSPVVVAQSAVAAMRKGGGGGGGRAENWAALSKAKVYDLIDEALVSQMDDPANHHPQLTASGENDWPGSRGRDIGHDLTRPRGTRSPAHHHHHQSKRPRTLTQNNNNNNTYNYSTVMKPPSSDQSLSPRRASQDGTVYRRGAMEVRRPFTGSDPRHKAAATVNNSKQTECWVALNKIMVFDIVDSAIRDNTKEDSASPEESLPPPIAGEAGRLSTVEGAKLTVHGKNSQTNNTTLSQQQYREKSGSWDEDAGTQGSPSSQSGAMQGSPLGRTKDGSPVPLDEGPPVLEPISHSNVSNMDSNEHNNVARRKRAHSLTADMESGGLTKKHKDLAGLPTKTSTPPPNIRDLTCRQNDTVSKERLADCIRHRVSPPVMSQGSRASLLKPSPSAPVDLTSWRVPSSPLSTLLGHCTGPRPRSGGSSPVPVASHGIRNQWSQPPLPARDNTHQPQTMHLGCSQLQPIDRATNEKFAAKQENIKGVHAATPVIRSPSRVPENNQCAPGDMQSSARVAGKAANTHIDPAMSSSLPSGGRDMTHGVVTAAAADDSRENSRSSPRLGWIAISKADVHTIVDSVVESMIKTSPEEAEEADDNCHTDDGDSQSVPSSKSSNNNNPLPSQPTKQNKRDDLTDRHSNTPSPVSAGRTSPEVPRHQVASLQHGDADDAPDSPYSNDCPSDSSDVGLASPSADTRRKSGHFKWKSSLMERVHEQTKSSSPPPTDTPSSGSSSSSSGSKDNTAPPDVGQDKSLSHAARAHKKQARQGNPNPLAKVK